MFIRNPHLVTSYYGSIVKKLGDAGSSIFEADHQFASYYVAGLAYYRLDSFFLSGAIDKKYKKVKFSILMLVTALSSEEPFPPLNSQRKVERYCQPIIDLLDNDANVLAMFRKAVAIIDESGVDINDKQFVKSKSMTDRIIQKLEENAT